jgi:hypothetical protein
MLTSQFRNRGSLLSANYCFRLHRSNGGNSAHLNERKNMKNFTHKGMEHEAKTIKMNDKFVIRIFDKNDNIQHRSYVKFETLQDMKRQYGGLIKDAIDAKVDDAINDFKLQNS